VLLHSSSTLDLLSTQYTCRCFYLVGHKQFEEVVEVHSQALVGMGQVRMVQVPLGRTAEVAEDNILHLGLEDLEEGNTGPGVVPAGSRPDSTWGKQFEVVSQDSVRPNGAASAYRPRDVLSNVYF